jgi:hypothetical protein
MPMKTKWPLPWRSEILLTKSTGSNDRGTLARAPQALGGDEALDQLAREVADHLKGEVDISLPCLHRASLEADGDTPLDPGLCQI